MARVDRKPRVAVDGAQGALRQSLPGLDAIRVRLRGGDAGDEGSVAPTAAAAATPPPGAAPASGGRASVYTRARKVVVRRERKGHGGKSATRIEGLAGSPREIDEVLREIKRALGCGASRDGADVVVQGAQGERLVAFLEARGVARIVVGS